MKNLYTLTIFLGAFLLFAVQPLIGKRLLPWFGGGASVWITLMLFFTTSLFIGYLYAFFISRLRFKQQRNLYLLSIGFAVFSLVGTFLFRHNLLNIFYIEQILTKSPIISILVIVSMCFGLPYILLATTTTILQSWYKMESSKSPYHLYAVSNIGSIVGLFTYPFLWEPFFTLKQQENWWTGLFLLFSICLIVITVSLKKKEGHSAVQDANFLPVPFVHMITWLVLSTLPVAMLLVVTREISNNLPSIPLLWLIPLGLYLLSFIIAFSNDKWYNRVFHVSVLIFSVFFSAALASSYFYVTQPILLSTLLITCFITGLVSHAELYRLRPHPNFLPVYYLIISFGGVLASIFCSIVAPLVFNDLWETPIVFVLAGIVGTIILYKTSEHWLQKFQYLLIGLSVVFAMGFMFYNNLDRRAIRPDVRLLETKRDFYGVSRITEVQQNELSVRWLINNKIDHGSQDQSKEAAFEPSTYYTRDSGVGIAITNHPKRLQKKPLNIGVVGLGVGTIAAYCNPGDYIRFYELNPNIVTLNAKYFSYIIHCREIGGKVDIIIGDARLSLEKEFATHGSQQFDILIVDAFTGDVVPVHLLTQEAIRLYISHLSNQGIIAFNLSNKYLDLVSAVWSTVRSMNVYSYFYSVRAKWFFVSLHSIPIPSIVEVKNQPPSLLRPWTDDYSNILPLIK